MTQGKYINLLVTLRLFFKTKMCAPVGLRQTLHIRDKSSPHHPFRRLRRGCFPLFERIDSIGWGSRLSMVRICAKMPQLSMVGAQSKTE